MRRRPRPVRRRHWRLEILLGAESGLDGLLREKAIVEELATLKGAGTWKTTDIPERADMWARNGCSGRRRIPRQVWYAAKIDLLRRSTSSRRARDCSCPGLLYWSDRRQERISERNTHLRRGYTPWTFHPQPIRQNLRGRSTRNFLWLEAAREEVVAVVGGGHYGGYCISGDGADQVPFRREERLTIVLEHALPGHSH